MAKKVYKNLDESINKEMNDNDTMVFKYDQSKYEIKEFNNNHDDRSLIEIRSKVTLLSTHFSVDNYLKAIIQVNKEDTENEMDTFVVISSKNIYGIKVDPNRINVYNLEYDYHFKNRIPEYSYIDDGIYLINQYKTKDYSGISADSILVFTDNPKYMTETISLESTIYYNPLIAKMLGDKSVLLSRNNPICNLRNTTIPEFSLIYGLNIEGIDKGKEPTFVTDCYYSMLNRRFQIINYDEHKKKAAFTTPSRYVTKLLNDEIEEYVKNYDVVEKFLMYGQAESLIHSLGPNKKS